MRIIFRIKYNLQNRKKLICLLFIIFILFDGIKSFALEILTLEDAVNIGLKNNYAIQLSKNELQISKENNTYGNSDMLPSINLNAGTDLSFKNNYFNTQMTAQATLRQLQLRTIILD